MTDEINNVKCDNMNTNTLVEYPEVTKEWLKNGKLHREDGPAIEWADGTKQWRINGLLHREDGPAWERSDGTKRWFIIDHEFSKECYDEIMGKLQENVQNFKAFKFIQISHINSQIIIRYLDLVDNLEKQLGFSFSKHQQFPCVDGYTFCVIEDKNLREELTKRYIDLAKAYGHLEIIEHLNSEKSNTENDCKQSDEKLEQKFCKCCRINY